jgi:hypothetical protein
MYRNKQCQLLKIIIIIIIIEETMNNFFYICTNYFIHITKFIIKIINMFRIKLSL